MRTACAAAALALALGGSLPVRADTAAEARVAAFVEANMVAVLYHEAAHALIDTLALDVPGREEDAADALAVILIDRLQDEAGATELVLANALAYRLFADGPAPPFRDGHSLDIERYYTLVCLFFGAEPDRRMAIADDLELPAPRRERCPEEWEAADNAWGSRLTDMPPQDHLAGFRMVSKADTPLVARIAKEVGALNGEYGLPVRIDISVETCGEANAFYDPRARRIVLCLEYAAKLDMLYRAALHEK